MDLTPIRIPGKRRSKYHEPEDSGFGPDRTAPSKKLNPSSKRSRARLRGASIERQFPLEILEPILSYSQNVNLVRASPRFGWMLSGLSTRRRVFIDALSPCWEMLFLQTEADQADESERLYNSSFQVCLYFHFGG